MVRIPSACLGNEFLSAVRVTFTSIEGTPEVGAIAFDDIRRVPMSRFPPVVYYVVESRGLIVIAVIHERRHPRRWQSRR